MTYRFTFDPKRKLIRVVQDGLENVHSALEVMREVRMHPEFHADYGILCDFRKGAFPRSKIELVKVSEVIKVFFPGQRIALTYSDPEREKGGNFVAASTGTVTSIRVFNDPEAAEAWLSSPSTTLPVVDRSKASGPPDANDG